MRRFRISLWQAFAADLTSDLMSMDDLWDLSIRLADFAPSYVTTNHPDSESPTAQVKEVEHRCSIQFGRALHARINTPSCSSWEIGQGTQWPAIVTLAGPVEHH